MDEAMGGARTKNISIHLQEHEGHYQKRGDSTSSQSESHVSQVEDHNEGTMVHGLKSVGPFRFAELMDDKVEIADTEGTLDPETKGWDKALKSKGKKEFLALSETWMS